MTFLDKYNMKKLKVLNPSDDIFNWNILIVIYFMVIEKNKTFNEIFIYLIIYSYLQRILLYR